MKQVPHVVKVGGSLFDLPGLGPCLRRWLDGLDGDVILVPGGGPTADVVRTFDRRQVLGQEKAHWLAHWLPWSVLCVQLAMCRWQPCYGGAGLVLVV